MTDTLFEEVAEDYVLPTMARVRGTRLNGLTAIGSFSGCGGSSLGLRMAGWDVRAAIEFIPAAAETYRANFPQCDLIEADIRTIQVETLLARYGLGQGELDLFEGSPPCASFSSAGMRERGWEQVKKYSDTKQRTDDLFWEWARLLEGLEPRAFVAENVPGLEMGGAVEEYAHKITRVLADAGSVGYRVGARILNAANFGVPQVRRRLIFIGIRKDLGREPEYPRPTTHVAHTLRQALASVDMLDADHAPFLADSSMRGMAVGRTWEWKKGLRRKDLCARCDKPLRDHRHVLKEVGSVKKGAGSGEERRSVLVPFCADGERGVEVKSYFLHVVPDLDRPCPTLTATGSQVGAASVVHPTECRKFTPREAAAISGFPPDFILTGTREQRYERIGRAVPPPLMAEVGRSVARVLTR